MTRDCFCGHCLIGQVPLPMPERPRGGVVTQRSANSNAAVLGHTCASRIATIYWHILSARAFFIRFFPNPSHRVR